MGGKIPHNWKVQQWTANGNIDRTFAECDDLSVAYAAYDAAVAKYPNYNITLRHGAQVMRENNRPPRTSTLPPIGTPQGPA